MNLHETFRDIYNLIKGKKRRLKCLTRFCVVIKHLNKVNFICIRSTSRTSVLISTAKSN